MAKYDWSDNSLPLIDIHSIRKHEVLSKYLKEYIKIVAGHQFKNSPKFTFIDGFCGGGIYQKNDGQIHQGSPFVFLNTAIEAEIELQFLKNDKDFQLDAHYYFIDSQQSCTSFLSNQLNSNPGLRARNGKSIHVVNNEFEKTLDKLISQIKSRGKVWRAVFFLDQYGYSQVSIDSIQKIFRELPQAEIILTFYVDYLIDYLTNNEQSQIQLSNLGIDYNLSNLDEEKKQQKWRFTLQHLFYEQITKASSAKHWTNFFVKSSESSKSYWMLHLSTHEKAKDEMQKIHWDTSTHFIGENTHGINMLAYDPKKDSEFTGQATFEFSNTDKIKNHELLLEQIPESLSYSMIQVNNYYKKVCNGTTATQDMIINALKDLSLCNEIEIVKEDGKVLKKGSKINPKYSVRIPRQISIKF